VPENLPRPFVEGCDTVGATAHIGNNHGFRTKT